MLLQDINEYTINDEDSVEINTKNDFINQENEMHVSVIKPITKRVVHCEDTKINAFYKPVELVEEVNTYVKKGDEYLVKLYENIKKLYKNNNESKLKSDMGLMKYNAQYNINNSVKQDIKNYNVQFNLYKECNNDTPKIETLFIPKLEKNIEVVNCLKEHINVDYTYLVPKPVVIPVDVPILKFRDNYKIVPIRKKIIPRIKYTDEVIYVDCCIEKPYIVYDDIILPIPCDVPIEENKYIDNAPLISE
ncbi:inner membrane complex protein 1d [Plasmodium berghei]|uniref:Inner membrane complex protein 1d n=3 Tax=Plasmodium berghei TaxID=5821 RepID=A0A509ANG2_PLABA|nr:inner membrane complex protein 1d [Plasmodium berghei ANKA]CXI77085.1 inner membrane complex protein 1d [Plasmodium berghei]SCM25004.1 inner membrane complex protein 1d [Plasmodium berghei]SCO61815.1 inner membrane complex protein 1d [Plasmodium berghei]VUC57090.1 inner membrane complex protein 1d [Plasmodium berghei ANKA]|eukprot:XP_034422869.1 inner membrane complex protein 1d [Plasmodium berghei ANKA]